MPRRPDYMRVLIRAREIISDRKRWTRNILARDARGKRVGACTPEAVRFCALGAVRRATCELGFRNPDSVITPLAETKAVAALDPYITSINDKQGRKAVLAEFDRAIGK